MFYGEWPLHVQRIRDILILEYVIVALNEFVMVGWVPVILWSAPVAMASIQVKKSPAHSRSVLMKVSLQAEIYNVKHVEIHFIFLFSDYTKT